MGKSLGKQDYCDLKRSDERSSELIIACSFIDITKLTIRFYIVWLVT